MTVKNYDKYLALSRVFNKTFGAPGANQVGTLKSSTETVTIKLIDDEMASAMFLIIVNFASEGMWRELRKRWLEEGLDKIKRTFDKATEEYNEMTGETVKFEIIKGSISDGLEFVNYSLYNPKKTAYFRVFLNAKIS